MGIDRKKVQIILIAVLAVLVIIILAQNLETAQTKLLFVTVEMPRAVLLLITLVIGFVLGMLFGSRLVEGKAKSAPPA